MPMAQGQKSRKMHDFMPMTEEGQRALEVAERAALQAGELVMKGWRAVGEISRKGRFDLLTEYDLASEELIRKQLSEEFPTHRIIGEEKAESGEGELVWYVDPIDGTTNFAHGHFFFAVSIALYRGSQGLAGVVHAPALGVTWKAAKGMGAFRNGRPARCRCAASSRRRFAPRGFRTTVGRIPRTTRPNSRSFSSEREAFGDAVPRPSTSAWSPMGPTTSIGSKG